MDVLCIAIVVVFIAGSKCQTDDVTFECPERDGIFSDPGDCSGYFICRDHEATKGSCGKNLHFRKTSPSDTYCDIPERAMCQLTPAETDNAATFGNTMASFCGRNSNGIYKSPDHCSRFTMCSYGERLYYECPGGMSFSSNEGVCVRNPYCLPPDDTEVIDDTQATGDTEMTPATQSIAEEEVEGDDDDTAEVGSGEDGGSGEEEVLFPRQQDLGEDTEDVDTEAVLRTILREEELRAQGVLFR